MKKLYKVASALNIKTEAIKNLIDNNEVKYELRGGVYYVNQNDVSDAHRLNRNYFVRIKVDDFDLSYNDTFSRSYNGEVDIYLLRQFADELEEQLQCYYDCRDVELTSFEGEDFDDVTLFLDIGNGDIDTILKRLSFKITEFQRANDGYLSSDEYKMAYGNGSWNYVSLCGSVKIKEYGLVETSTLVS